MNEVLLGISIAYAFLLAVLLLSLIYSRLHWLIKLTFIVVSTGFYIVSYQGWKETQGWPTLTAMPKHFLLHYAVIEEPDEELSSEGAIYLWASDLEDKRPADQPRAYKLDYDQNTHGKVANALREIQNGNVQIGQISRQPNEHQVSKNKERMGHKYEGLEFVKLPDPALPEK